MKRADELPIDPEVAGGLEAIDAALAGRAVDSGHRDLGDLAVALAAERPQIDPAFAAELDELIERRRPSARRSAWRGRWWIWSPAAALAACLLVAVVIVTQQGSGGTVRTLTQSQNRMLASPAAVGSAGSQGAAEPSAAPRENAPAVAQASGQTTAVLQPPANGRKILQSAQLELTVAPERIDTVAQEVYDVVGQAQGFVNSSTVTAGGATGGYAQFQLSVPSSSLPQAMASLSGLRYAQVASRTDNTQDVNDEYQRDVRQLADARALRTSLLRQLAKATTQQQIDSLTARIHDAEASISSDEATLAHLNHKINFTQITLTINSGSLPTPAGGGGFTIGKAAHTAGRVLTVAAGVLLIAAAALLPLTGLAALGLWATTRARRRRREHTLDLA